MIEKIDVNHFGCFSDFTWNAEVRDPSNNIARFKKMNIIYGRNYSGKTTLSRIVRALETGSVSPRYAEPSFTITLSTGTVTSGTVSLQNHDVRVYNKDFVDEHLAFLRDEQGHISPFAVLGQENKEIESEIERLEAELGSVEKQIGLRYNYQEKKKEYAEKQKQVTKAREELESKLIDKANKKPTGVKHNPLYKDVNYDVRKLKADIQVIRDGGISPLDESERSAKVSLLGETALPDIRKRLSFDPALSALARTANDLLTKKIKPSAPIQDLLNDALLQTWVRSGVGLHRERRTTCGFCGNPLPADLWEKLGNHFNKDSLALEKEIDSLLQKIVREKDNIRNFATVERSGLYSSFQPKLDVLKSSLEAAHQIYEASLATLECELGVRKKDIFSERAAVSISNNSETMHDIMASINELISKSNETTASLAEKQKAARDDVRLSEVSQFILDIDLAGEDEKIKKLGTLVTTAKEVLDEILAEGNKRTDRIKELKTQLRDERRGAEKVNQYLGHFLGHGGLRLSAVEETDSATYRFEIKRGDSSAYNLSEGECSLVAFCYFLARLEDVETKGKKLILYIDDPISSLDSNHIFFIYSLIENYLARPIELTNGEPVLDANGKPEYRYEQMFISTHNLEFLKYLKRLTKPAKDHEHFLLTRKERSSAIGLMPNYLRNYVTELNFLFGEIYCCSDQGNAARHYHSFYNFGNNLRKFLEAFLFFKYPFFNSERSDYDKRVKMFFSDGTNSEAFVQRLTNEFSHLGEFIDRGTQPVDSAEIATVAKFVLKKIRDNDKEQFDHFLLSIEKTDPFC
ncbi:wobble nucleotide-excising tRNase [Paraburkholderia sp. BL6669N2]|uniref:AAA family ATPase n=1 Tax=Paraburkholderia sp. BL6669N2 TaxID=1938807 RepID=UPI000E257C55|nr:AAA family ATPase [Paraburkholderia sp. BL6669N2]REG58583.1 wobble nucleotide-excising tRNase [Paraburkholderia sp. BL6669N2]